MPENLHTKNINTYEQTLNINIKPLQATYKHPAPSTPLLYIFSPTASSPTCPKWAILGCGNLDSATTQRFFRLVHHSPRYFALRPPCQKLQGHDEFPATPHSQVPHVNQICFLVQTLEMAFYLYYVLMQWNSTKNTRGQTMTMVHICQTLFQQTRHQASGKTQ